MAAIDASSLRYLQLSHMGFQGQELVGELVVHEQDVLAVAIAFKLMWDAGVPIEFTPGERRHAVGATA